MYHLDSVRRKAERSRIREAEYARAERRFLANTRTIVCREDGHQECVGAQYCLCPCHDEAGA